MPDTPEPDTPEILQVALGSRSYPIIVGNHLLGAIDEYIKQVHTVSNVIIISDEQVSKFYLHRVTGALSGSNIPHRILLLPAGESTKSAEHFLPLVENILSTHPDRRTLILALGGGVVGDIAGFAASVTLRGIDFIQVPTTLLAQVDSAVGGKTAINSKHGKNLIGSFHQPILVIADTDTLTTLPKRELLAGYAEIVKYGMLGDINFFTWLEAHGSGLLAGDATLQREAILTCCKMKATIVAEDEREAGKRALLNLGHTFGHALEAECGYDERLLHGEAVALGMLLACALSEVLGLCNSEPYTRLYAHLTHIGLPTTITQIAHDWQVDTLIQHMYHDKKAESGMLTFVLIEEIGKACVRKRVTEDAVRKVLSSHISS